MRIAYFDCFSGISGNMILGALLSAGLPQAALEEDLQALNLPGWELRVTQGIKGSMAGTHVDVVQTQHEHAHRTIRDIEQIVTQASLPQYVCDTAMQVFERIAEAEGRVHGVPDTEVHFHEVGAIDSIVDIVGCISGLHRLGLDAIWASPIHVGSGFVQAAHGRIPVPAPATLEILRGVPIYSTDIYGELATPTGAAILKTVATHFGPWPTLKVEAIGYGLGTKDFAIPNVLRLAIGTMEGSKEHTFKPAIELTTLHDHDHDHDHAAVLEANIDDMNPEFTQYVVSAVLNAGALDAYYTSILMKKGRPALKLTVLCPEEAVSACLSIIFKETTTLGVRQFQAIRTKLQRSWVDALVAGQRIRVKVGKMKGQVVNIAPEFEDCQEIARITGMPLKQVYDLAKAAVQQVS